MKPSFTVTALSPWEGQDLFYERGFGGGIQWSPAGVTVAVAFWKWRIVFALWAK